MYSLVAFFNPQSQIEALGGSITSVGNDLLATFTQSGTFVVPITMTASVLIVGGGAGGERLNLAINAATYAGRGGDGGGVYSGVITIQPGSYTISIGAGGAARIANTGPSTAGNDTTAFGFTGSAGPGNNSKSNTTYGINPSPDIFVAAGGSGNLVNLPTSSPIRGALGFTSSITGTSRSYGAGGGGGAMGRSASSDGGTSGGTSLNGGGEEGDGGDVLSTSVSNGRDGIWGGGGGGNSVRTTATTTQASASGKGGDGIVLIRWTPK